MGMLKEFKQFALQGNLVDIAVAFVMGAAFGKVITAFTEGLIAPIITLLTGGANFDDKICTIRESTQKIDTAGKTIGDPAVVLKWGHFVTTIIDFIIVAFVMFLVIKAINSMKKKQAAAPAEPSSTDKLLMEIRDTLKK